MPSFGYPSERYGYQPESHYGIRARLWIYVARSSVDMASRPISGWLERRLGGAREDGASLIVGQDFLQSTKGFLEERQMTHILNIWIGNHAVFRSTQGSENTNTRTLEDNIMSAFATVSSSAADQGNNITHAGVSAHGFDEEFELEFQFTLSSNDDPSRPPITIQVLALPIELSWKDGEELLDHIDRLNQFLDNREEVRSQDERARVRMGQYLERLRESLTRTYDAYEVKYEFAVDLGSIVW